MICPAALIVALCACTDRMDPSRSKMPVTENQSQEPLKEATSSAKEGAGTETVTLGAGCFWCIEAVLEQIEGISDVTSGYMGGTIENPTYEQICTGTTNHAEVVEVTFDPNVISFEKLMDVFWQLHDPTTLNRQGFDVGTQYRSAVFYHNDEQRKIAEASKKKWDASGTWPNPIVTEITAAEIFYPAEIYHQDYFALNGKKSYCRVHIRPKLKKFKRVFREYLKE